LTAKTRSHSSSGVSATVPRPATPAQATQMSSEGPRGLVRRAADVVLRGYVRDNAVVGVDLRQPLLVQVESRHAHAVAPQARDRCRADAGRAAGDERPTQAPSS
jgi:hypothetical protein